MDCTICSKPLDGLICSNEWCGEEHHECSNCKKVLRLGDLYDYRGSDLACEHCIDKVTADRDRLRNEIIAEESAKTECFRGLDLGDGVFGKHNRKLLARKIEIAGKESDKLKAYEGR